MILDEVKFMEDNLEKQSRQESEDAAGYVPRPAWQGLADLVGPDLDLFLELLPQLLRLVFPAQPRPAPLPAGRRLPEKTPPQPTGKHGCRCASQPVGRAAAQT